MKESNLLIASSTNVKKDANTSRSQGSAVKWFPPPMGLIKLNCDAASFAYKGCTGLAWVAKDCTSRLIVAWSQLIPGKLTPSVAKALCIPEALN